MKQYECRIAIRLQAPEREGLEQLIFERKFKNLSQAIRAAINDYLSKQEASGVEQ
jgi:Arc/MetJ-type ribon-helix-helix transcriptional regulator